MDREAWSAAVHWVAKSQTQLSDWIKLNWYFTQYNNFNSSFLCSKFQPGYHISFCHRCLLGSSCCDSFSEFPCFWWLWYFCSVLTRKFLECTSVWVWSLSGVCLWLNRVYGFGEENPVRQSTVLITLYWTHTVSMPSLLMLTLTTGWGHVCQDSRRVTLSPVSTAYSLEESLCALRI